ncbi:MAG: hypothetical protein AB7H43_04175 [Acidimicrobiia bacterium]
MTDTASTESSPAASPTAPLALVVSIGLAAVLALIVLTLSFSTANVPASVDGTSATTSQYLPDGE